MDLMHIFETELAVFGEREVSGLSSMVPFTEKGMTGGKTSFGENYV